jgi:hypothetical protein
MSNCYSPLFCVSTLAVFYFFFLSVLEFEVDFLLTKQEELYHLSHAPRHFFVFVLLIFHIGSHGFLLGAQTLILLLLASL